MSKRKIKKYKSPYSNKQLKKWLDQAYKDIKWGSGVNPVLKSGYTTSYSTTGNSSVPIIRRDLMKKKENKISKKSNNWPYCLCHNPGCADWTRNKKRCYSKQVPIDNNPNWWYTTTSTPYGTAKITFKRRVTWHDVRHAAKWFLTTTRDFLLRRQMEY